MPYEEFIPKTFQPKHVAIIDTANAIMRRYADQGYDISVRQLYYQFVAHHGLPNNLNSYKMLGSVVNDARLAGRLDWGLLVDRGRPTHEIAWWHDVRHRLDAAARTHNIDMWANQPCRVLVMVEKQALEGVLLPVCDRWNVPFPVNKGYSSASAFYRVGKRIARWNEGGQRVVVLYLGDHDPSGIDMTRDVRERLALFSGNAEWDKARGKIVMYSNTDDYITVKRVALNMDQIEEYNPPPNYAKESDSRYAQYVAQYGEDSWELDALNPNVLGDLIQDAIREEIDGNLWNVMVDERDAQRQRIRSFIDTL